MTSASGLRSGGRYPTWCLDARLRYVPDRVYTMLGIAERGVPGTLANLAARMFGRNGFDPERFVAGWSRALLGSICPGCLTRTAPYPWPKRLKAHHPMTPIIMGGYSATYFHEELIRYPPVDYVLRGDSTELPLERLMEHIVGGSAPTDVPNLTWKDAEGVVHVNPLTYVPDNLDALTLDYRPMVKSVVRHVDLANAVPFSHWLEYRSWHL